MKRFPFSFFIVLLLLAGGCGRSASSRIASKLEVRNFQFTRLEGGTRVFTGKIYNPTDHTVRGVQLQVSLLDADNRQISSTLIEVRNIAAQGSTAFRQPFDSDEEAEGARVRSLTAL